MIDRRALERNLAVVRDEIDRACERAGRDPSGVTLCVATKYVDAGELDTLAAAGVRVLGENRLQDLVTKQLTHGDRFEWHFIGTLQSRKAAEIADRVRVIHSLSTESAARRLADVPRPGPGVLVQVNVADEPGKAGVRIGELDELLARCATPPAGLMTMPPRVLSGAEDNRSYFRTLADLAAARGLPELSMGTSQDYVVAVEEGATIVRLGSALFTEE